LLLWEETDNGAAAVAKRNHLAAEFKLTVPSWFQKPFERLARRLHGFFRSRVKAQVQAGAGMLTPPNPRSDYHDFVSRFTEAIRELEPSIVLMNEDAAEYGENQGEQSQVEQSGHESRKRHCQEDEPLDSEPVRKKVRMNTAEAVVGKQAIELVDLFKGDMNHDVMLWPPYFV
jgi:hypothetical protein